MGTRARSTGYKLGKICTLLHIYAVLESLQINNWRDDHFEIEKEAK